VKLVSIKDLGTWISSENLHPALGGKATYDHKQYLLKLFQDRNEIPSDAVVKLLGGLTTTQEDQEIY